MAVGANPPPQCDTREAPPRRRPVFSPYRQPHTEAASCVEVAAGVRGGGHFVLPKTHPCSNRLTTRYVPYAQGFASPLAARSYSPSVCRTSVRASTIRWRNKISYLRIGVCAYTTGRNTLASINATAVTYRREKRSFWGNERKKYPIAPGNTERIREGVVGEFLNVQARVAPVSLEPRFLFAVETLDVRR